MKIALKKLSFAIAGAGMLALYGCGGGGGTTASTSPTLVSGVASKGPLNGSTVCAYAIVANIKSSALGPCATNIVNGNYSIDIGTYTGPVLFEATGGTYTDEATGEIVALASPLRSMLSNATGNASSVAVTALTELAYQDANSVVAGLTSARIESAIASVQTHFGVADIVNTMPVDALSVPAGATAEQKTYALALATVSQYQKGQPDGTSLVNTLQSIRACLAEPNSCGTGGTSVGSNLNAAMTTFKSIHPAFSGLNLPVTSFGVSTDSASITITVAGLNDPKHKAILQNGTLIIGTYGGVIDTLLGKVEITADGTYSFPKSTSGATSSRIIQQPAGQACQFTKLRQNHFDPYTQQLITEYRSNVYCYESPCGNLISLGLAPAPQELKAIWNSDSTVTLNWKIDPWADSYKIYYGNSQNVVANNSVGTTDYQYLTLGIGQSGSTSTGNLDPTKLYYFAISSMYSSPSNLDACQSSASSVVPLQLKTVAPTMIGMNPTIGAAGTTVIISGANFDSTTTNNEVMFNGVQATVTSATATLLTVIVPSGVKTGKVTVGTASGKATSTGDFTVEVASSSANTLTYSPQLAGGFGSVNFTPSVKDNSYAPNGRSEYQISISAPNGPLGDFVIDGTIFYTKDPAAGTEFLNLPFSWMKLNSRESVFMKPMNVNGCLVSGNPDTFDSNTTYQKEKYPYPLCSTLGITFSAAAGTVNFNNVALGEDLHAASGSSFDCPNPGDRNQECRDDRFVTSISGSLKFSPLIIH